MREVLLMTINRQSAWQSSRPGTAFSNSTEWELWSARWCAQCSRDAFADYGAGCPLITIAVCGRIPEEWIEAPHEQVFTDRGMNVPELYSCVEFRPRGGGDPQPRPQPEPDQDGLFERPQRTVRMLTPGVSPADPTNRLRPRTRPVPKETEK